MSSWLDGAVRQLDASTSTGTITVLVIETTLLLALALSSAALLAGRSARARHLVLCAGLFAATALPVLALTLPARGVALLPARPQPIPSEQPNHRSRAAPHPTAAQPASDASAAPVQTTRDPTLSLLVLLWLLPTGALLSQLVRGLAGAVRARRSSEDVTADPTWSRWIDGRHHPRPETGHPAPRRGPWLDRGPAPERRPARARPHRAPRLAGPDRRPPDLRRALVQPARVVAGPPPRARSRAGSRRSRPDQRRRCRRLCRAAGRAGAPRTAAAGRRRRSEPAVDGRRQPAHRRGPWWPLRGGLDPARRGSRSEPLRRR